jgi:L-malate glycosyltransferase
VKPIKILHCHSTFSLGGKEARAIRLMNAFGERAEHTILSAVPDALGARAAIRYEIKADFPGDAAPALHGKPGIHRYRALSRYMAGFDLVLTYNWGAMDAVGARRCFPRDCPPLIHHEDGFNADEAVRLNWKRNMFRRLMLPAAQTVIVPSQRLETIAQTVWRQPHERLLRVPNGVNVKAYTKHYGYAELPGFYRQDGDVVVGTLAGMRPVKNLLRLVRAVAAQPKHVKLIIVGEGPDREDLILEAFRLGISERLILPGFLPAPYRYVSYFDIFALSSDSEQFPISLVEAMAAGLPALSTDVGDVMAMVAPQNRDFVVPLGDEQGYVARLAQLIADEDLRKTIGAANLSVAKTAYDEKQMIATYAKVYGAAIGDEQAFI